MNILEALDDPELLAGQFCGTSWGVWRVWLKALFALPMDADELAIYWERTGRTEPPAAPFIEATLVCGRRAGKSRMMGLLAVYLATCRDYAPHLAPGEVATVGVIAADRRQARTVMRYISGALNASPMLASLIEDEKAESIALSNRVVIEIGTASFRVTRGYSYAAILADETAYWRSDESSANPDSEIFAALRPGMATIPGALLINASSPYRKRGELWKSYSRSFGKDDPHALVWQAPTLAMNPELPAHIVDRAYEDDPESAAAEYGAEFRSDLSDFIPRAVVDACTVAGRYELPPMPGVRYVAFIDPSGGTGSDSMTLAIAHRQGDLAVLDCVREVRPPFSPEAVCAEFAAALRSYGVTKVTGDRYAGEWPREALCRHGIAYDLSDRVRSELYLDVLPVLNSRRAELLDLPRLAGQLCGLERRTSRSGRDSVDHGPTGHDDLANVVAGALLLAGTANTVKPARYVNFSFMGR